MWAVSLKTDKKLSSREQTEHKAPPGHFLSLHFDLCIFQKAAKLHVRAKRREMTCSFSFDDNRLARSGRRGRGRGGGGAVIT